MAEDTFSGSTSSFDCAQDFGSRLGRLLAPQRSTAPHPGKAGMRTPLTMTQGESLAVGKSEDGTSFSCANCQVLIAKESLAGVRRAYNLSLNSLQP